VPPELWLKQWVDSALSCDRKNKKLVDYILVLEIIGMAIGALGVVHASYVRHQRLQMDRRKLWVRGDGQVDQ